MVRRPCHMAASCLLPLVVVVVAAGDFRPRSAVPDECVSVCVCVSVAVFLYHKCSNQINAKGTKAKLAVNTRRETWFMLMISHTRCNLAQARLGLYACSIQYIHMSLIMWI